MTGDDRTRLALRAYVKLLRATRSVLSVVEPRLTEAGLTPTQLGVLEAILHKGSMTQRALQRRVLTSAGNMTDVIDKLERRGLVERRRSESDRRLVTVDLTPQGRCLIETLFPCHAADVAAAMAGLDAARLVRLDELLRKLGLAAAHLAERPTASHLAANHSTSNDLTVGDQS